MADEQLKQWLLIAAEGDVEPAVDWIMEYLPEIQSDRSIELNHKLPQYFDSVWRDQLIRYSVVRSIWRGTNYTYNVDGEELASVRKGISAIVTMISNLLEDEWQKRQEEKNRKKEDPLQGNKHLPHSKTKFLVDEDSVKRFLEDRRPLVASLIASRAWNPLHDLLTEILQEVLGSYYISSSGDEYTIDDCIKMTLSNARKRIRRGGNKPTERAEEWARLFVDNILRSWQRQNKNDKSLRGNKFIKSLRQKYSKAFLPGNAYEEMSDENLLSEIIDNLLENNIYYDDVEKIADRLYAGQGFRLSVASEIDGLERLVRDAKYRVEYLTGMVTERQERLATVAMEEDKRKNLLQRINRDIHYIDFFQRKLRNLQPRLEALQQLKNSFDNPPNVKSLPLKYSMKSISAQDQSILEGLILSALHEEEGWEYMLRDWLEEHGVEKGKVERDKGRLDYGTINGEIEFIKYVIKSEKEKSEKTRTTPKGINNLARNTANFISRKIKERENPNV